MGKDGETNLTVRKVSVAIPASVVSDTPHLREKTSKIGLIGRAAAIFRISEIIIYPDNPHANQERDMDLVATLLTYVETPQYLRKRLFKLKPELQYAGILPPLRTPHHPLNRRMKDLKVGEYREGATVSQMKEGTLIDIGVEEPAVLSNTQLPVNKRVSVKVKKIDDRFEVELADHDRIPEYWGYLVSVERQPFGKLVRGRRFGLTIATSKFGLPFADVADEIAERWQKAETVLVAFGAPSQGLHEVVKREDLNLDDIADFVINTIPMQGTETVRTEEALITSLAILNERFHL
jgi:hypothetical protein